MTSTFDQNPLPSPFPVEVNEDQHPHELFITTLKPQASSSSSSSLSSPFFLSPSHHDQAAYHYIDQLQHPHHPQEAHDKLVVHGSCDLSTTKNEEDGFKFSICRKEEREENYQGEQTAASVKWMSSKMRLMRKMTTNPHQISGQKYGDQQKQLPSSPQETDHSTNNNSLNNTIRVCSDCNTTKTPLWRSGPRGPKSLCNACGIRQRKARRAMATAAAVNGGAILATDPAPPYIKSTNRVQHKEKKSNATGNYVAQHKKGCKLTPSRGRKKLCLEDFVLSLSKNSAFHRVFPQDEKEAAILLMALSCGLVCG